jgi:hypothetical protein
VPAEVLPDTSPHQPHPAVASDGSATRTVLKELLPSISSTVSIPPAY